MSKLIRKFPLLDFAVAIEAKQCVSKINISNDDEEKIKCSTISDCDQNGKNEIDLAKIGIVADLKELIHHDDINKAYEASSIEISHEELKNIKLSAFLDGKNASIAELEAKYEILLKKKNEDNDFVTEVNVEKLIIATLSSIENKVSLIENEMSTAILAINKQCLSLAYGIAKKLVNKLTIHMPEELVLNFIEEKLKLLIDEASIDIIVHPDISDKIEQYILQTQFLHTSTVRVVANSDISLGDCIIDWKKGKIIKDADLLLQEIDLVLKNYIK